MRVFACQANLFIIRPVISSTLIETDAQGCVATITAYNNNNNNNIWKIMQKRAVWPAGKGKVYKKKKEQNIR